MELRETHVNLIAEGTHVKGDVVFDHISRVHGTLTGDVEAKDGSVLIFGETSVIEGNVSADTLVVDGYVKGDIEAKTKVTISRTGRVIGNVKTPTLTVEFGAYFDGKCVMDGAPTLTSNREFQPA